MPKLSGILLPTTTEDLAHVPFSVDGEPLRGDGYYGFSDGLHTIAHFLTGFIGTLEVQGTLAIEPEDEDWITLNTVTGTLTGPANGFADALISGAQVGTTVPALGAATYDFDVTIDGGALQPLSIVIAGGEDYDAIAALMSTAVVGGTVSFIASSFRVTSDTASYTSAATVAAGTTGSGGGDLFAAIDLAETVTTTFPTPTPGLAGAVTENLTYNFTGNYVWVRAVVTDITYGTITKVQMNH